MAYGTSSAEDRINRKARMEERLNRAPLPPMIDNAGGAKQKKEKAAKKAGGNKTRGKQALSIVGDVNQRALERIAKKFKQHPLMLTPLEVLVEIASDVNASNNARLTAANAAAPYLHKKMTSFTDDQVAATGTAPPVINIVEVKNDNAELRADLEKELDAAIANAGKTRTE